MSEAKIKDLVKKRGSIKAKLTQFSSFLTLLQTSESLSEVQFKELEYRFRKIEQLYSDFDTLQTEIETLTEPPETAYQDREAFDGTYFRLLSEAQVLLSPQPNTHGRRSSILSDDSIQSNEERRHDFVRLPKINLPHFDGDYQHWLEFRDTYLSLIHNNNSISDINKFHYLRAALKVKAVHLELVTDLTKEAFLAALNRFTSRRGKPATIFSDNGTTFIGACNELAQFLKNSLEFVQCQLIDQGINFKRIPAYSPNFGGIWEAAVKSVKHHLRRVLSLTHFNYEEMATCLAQIEAILNSRPLTPLSSDPSDLSYLSPAHFLVGRPLLSAAHPNLLERNINRLQRYQRVEQLRQHFWQRYSLEYVSLLQTKTKWRQSNGQLKVGSLVLVRDRTQPPLLWLMGRVTKIFYGGDSVGRVAVLLTKKGTITRAYNNICPLPTDDISPGGSVL
ncbi:uncharacterized protein [Maniola hyperantus]|uniref:uncharacterized protein n=1 Tax=Aphantopus hyperantus TaxID=2795564 RepID=UPI0037486157